MVVLPAKAVNRSRGAKDSSVPGVNVTDVRVSEAPLSVAVQADRDVSTPTPEATVLLSDNREEKESRKDQLQFSKLNPSLKSWARD